MHVCVCDHFACCVCMSVVSVPVCVCVLSVCMCQCMFACAVVRMSVVNVLASVCPSACAGIHICSQ